MEGQNIMIDEQLSMYEAILMDCVGVSEDALDLVVSLNGWTEETLDDVLFYYTGYHNLDQYLQNEMVNILTGGTAR